MVSTREQVESLEGQPRFISVALSSLTTCQTTTRTLWLFPSSVDLEQKEISPRSQDRGAVALRDPKKIDRAKRMC